MQDNSALTLPGMPASPRACGVLGCKARLYRDNQSGFCPAHRTRKSRTGPRFCSIEECGQPLHYKTESGFCSIHAPTHTPAAVKREATRLAEREARRSQWRECSAGDCEKRLQPRNKSGRCYDHRHIPVDPAERGRCPIDGCGRRLSRKNTLGRCEKHSLPRWVAAECSAEGCEKKLNVNNLAGLCLEHTDNNDRAKRLQRMYGISEAQYDAMLAGQNGVCAVCGKPPKPGGVQAAGLLHVDHDHACCPGRRSCGKCVRALLCLNCNNGLGHFSDNPELLRLAIGYLERYAALSLT